MTEPASIESVIGFLVRSAPHWFPALRDTVFNTGKDALIKKSQERVQTFLDEEKHQHQMERALRNAAERGARQWQTLEERDCYKSVLRILTEGHSETLRQEAMQLFTLSDDPDLANLTEKYNLSQRITALAHHTTHTEVDAGPYLQSFFVAFLSELYNDPLFRAQMSDVIRVRAAMQGTRSLEEILHTLQTMQGLLSDEYTPQDFQRELEKYLKYLEQKYCHHRFAGIVMRGDEDKAPKLDHIFVPLRISLRLVDTPETDLVTLLEKHPYLVLLGGPGSGKSTATCHLAWLHAKANRKATEQTAEASVSASATLTGQPLPLRIELRLFSEARRQNAGYNFLSYASQVLLEGDHVTVSSQMFETLLERRALFVLFDGLDEVATLDERERLVKLIEQFTQQYPGNRVLVTSRPVGYEVASISNPAFREAGIHSFNGDQIRQFLESWYRHVLRLSPLPSDAQQELEAFFTLLKATPRLYELATNPLLLTVMTALHRYERLPDERGQVYDKCADLLLDTWVRLKYKSVRWKDMKLSKRDQKACVAHLGFVLHHRAQEVTQSERANSPYMRGRASNTAVDVPADFLSRELEHFLAQQDLLTTKAEQRLEIEFLLDMMGTEAGLLVRRGTGQDGKPLYGFVHRTFQEYFAALDVWNRSQQEGDATIIREFLAEHVHDPHWQEVILLLLSNFKHKFASSLLQFILEGKTRRSSYSNTLQHDLFFVANCLTDGIDVDQTFAKEIIDKLSKIVWETPFTAQRQEAITLLVALRRTRHYADLSKHKMQLSQWPSEDRPRQLQVAQAFYTKSPVGSQGRLEAARLLNKIVELNKLSFESALPMAQTIYRNSPAGSDEQREGTRLLINWSQQRDFLLDQALPMAQTIYRNSPAGSDEQREGARLLINWSQQRDFSLDQALQIARAIYQNSPTGSDEQHEGARLLIARWQREDLPFDQALQVVQTIYQNSPVGSDEQHEGTRLLIEKFQPKDLSLDQVIQMAQAISQYSPAGSDEQREGARLLIARWQREDLPFEQALQVGQAIYQYSPTGSDERCEGVRILLAVVQPDGLYVDPALRVAQTIYQHSPTGSEEQREGVRLLVGWFQGYQISIDQAFQIARAIYQYSPTGSDEQHEGARLLIARWQREDLPFEQALQMAQAIYQCSPAGSDEQCEGTRLLIASFQSEDLPFDQLLQMAQTIYRNSPAGSDEQREGTRLLIARWQQKDLPFEQALPMAQAIHQYSPAGSDEQCEGTRLLIASFQHEELSFEHALPMAQAIYRNSPAGSDEQREGTRLLINWSQQRDLLLDQALQMAQTIYRNSPAGSDEQREGARLLINWSQQKDLLLDQALQIARAIYQNSPTGSDEQHEGARLLIARWQREDLPFDQALQMAQTIYQYSSPGSDEPREGFRLLIEKFQPAELSANQVLQIAKVFSDSSIGQDERCEVARLLIKKFQQEDLSIDQALQMAQAIYQYSSAGSDEQLMGAQLLVAQFRQEDLSLDQALQMAQTIYRNSPAGSDEQYEIVRLLIEKLQREKLSIDQVCQLVEAIYRYSSPDSDEPHVGFRLLIEKFQPDGLSINQVLQIAQTFLHSRIGSDERCEVAQWFIEKFQSNELSIDQALQIAQAIYRYGPYGSKERRKGAWLLNELVHHNELSVDQTDEVYGTFVADEMMRYDDAIPAISAIIKLATQDAIPLETRDSLYQLLQHMLPLFVQIDITQMVAKKD